MRPHFMQLKFRRFVPLWFLLACLVAPWVPLHGQVAVDMKIGRSLYIVYEPLIATVSIRNLSGRELFLSDDGPTPWFGFQVTTRDGLPVPSRHGNYSLDPMLLGPGETIHRQVNLTPLYPLDSFGGYRIQASVHDPQSKRFYSSRPTLVEITDGRVLWQRTVGVPEDGSRRTITLLSHRLPNSTGLYLRIQDEDGGRVYCTHRLGRLVSFGPPEIELDIHNEIHVLQMRAPNSFLYSHIGLGGEIRQRTAYEAEHGVRPALRRDDNGRVAVIGGREFDPTEPAFETTVPSLADRPVPMPQPTGPQAQPTPQRGMFDFLRPRDPQPPAEEPEPTE